MFDVAIAYNRYKFLGYEFLTWLWFIIDQDRNKIENPESEPVSLQIGNYIVLENQLSDSIESITIKGDDADLVEGMLALKKGAVVTELNLSYQAGDNYWRFTLKGESFNVSSIRLPETGPLRSKKDFEGIVLEKTFLVSKAFQIIDALFKQFIHIRVSPDWQKTIVPLIKKWIFS